MSVEDLRRIQLSLLSLRLYIVENDISKNEISYQINRIIEDIEEFKQDAINNKN